MLPPSVTATPSLGWTPNPGHLPVLSVRQVGRQEGGRWRRQDTKQTTALPVTGAAAAGWQTPDGGDGSACRTGRQLGHSAPGCCEQGEDIHTIAWGLSVIRPDVLVTRSQAARCSKNRLEVSPWFPPCGDVPVTTPGKEAREKREHASCLRGQMSRAFQSKVKAEASKGGVHGRRTVRADDTQRL